MLREEVVRLLGRHGACFIDATVGNGGHAAALLSAAGPASRLLGLDLDEAALSVARTVLAPFGRRVELVHENFAVIAGVARARGFQEASAILFDLGLRSDQLQSGRGFSFQEAASLDMRFDATGSVVLPPPRFTSLRRLAGSHPSYTAADVVARLTAEELAELFETYGDERQARRIARAVVEARRHGPLRTSAELAAQVIHALPPAARHRRIHGATRVFQALRIAVNREPESLALGLQGALALLASHGRLAVIAYHSGEDRTVKWFFRGAAGAGLFRILTKHPLVPSADEQRANPRSRSAKLRVLEHQPSP